MNTKFCQSCGMPMEGADAPWGTNADGSKNEDYCSYCYQKGSFTSDLSMEEMIEFCVPHMTAGTVSYTHLDVYKRQSLHFKKQIESQRNALLYPYAKETSCMSKKQGEVQPQHQQHGSRH